MTEKELLEKLKQSAETVKVPESLSPDNMIKTCQKEKRSRRKKRGTYAAGISAAAVFFICCISLMGMNREKMFDTDSSGAIAAPEDTLAEAGEQESAVAEDILEEPEFEEEAAPEEEAPEKQNAGEVYVLAQGYEEIYSRLEEEWNNMYSENGARDEAMASGAVEDYAYAESESMKEDAVSGSPDTAEHLQNLTTEKKSYSTTNVQTYGIDESDIIKTDGEYLYCLRGSQVSIVKAGEEGMELVTDLAVEGGLDGAETICAMYVDGNRLILVSQSMETVMEQARKKAYYEDVLYDMDSRAVTTALTYDISDKKSPRLIGKVKQDGVYQTSRKDGNLFYLFTRKNLLKDYDGNETAIPKVNEKEVAADCIYIAERGTQAMVISSVILAKPDEVRDSVMIVDEGATVYMGEDSLYLYSRKFNEWQDYTEIARFTLKNGYINGAAAASVNGTVEDVFAVNEKDGKLRVLTTDYSQDEWENCVILLDENLKVTGSLGHIAVGERIYAARFLGDTAYFITYRNTDPLFAVDLSDEKNPKMLSEVGITGFSEYLHFWGEDKLLGIGYETDPDSGEQKGLKLVMFDMADPADLKILGTKVLEGTDYSPALYDYKAVLADAEENLIGFVTQSYTSGKSVMAYSLFSWNGEGFEKLLEEKIGESRASDNYRGLYIGEQFYIASPEIIRYYDRKDYTLKQTLELEE